MWRLVFVLAASPALADSVVATRTIRAQTELTAEDLTLVAMEIPGSVTSTSDAIGKEARVTIYAGRPILQTDLGQNAIIDRNQIVPLRYVTGSLAILTEGRALARGGIGDVIEVMNLSSRNKVMGRIEPDGTVRVGPIS